jgi:hypothetical protein
MYYVPLSRDFPAVDALTKERALQYSVTDNHPIKGIQLSVGSQTFTRITNYPSYLSSPTALQTSSRSSRSLLLTARHQNRQRSLLFINGSLGCPSASTSLLPSKSVASSEIPLDLFSLLLCINYIYSFL